MTTDITPQADRMIRHAAHNLIHLAAIHGQPPTLETQPRQPLAMGNHGLRLTLRPVRNPDPAAADNCRRPDLLEKLTYHEGARHDMSLEDCMSFLADGWKETPGRSYTQLVLQLTELLAAAPSKPYCWSDCTAYTAGIESELQALRKKVATYEARDALGLVPQPAGEKGPDGKEWAKTAAGYTHVQAMVPLADGQSLGPFWYGWALRGAFVAGAEWQESREALATAQAAPAAGAVAGPLHREWRFALQEAIDTMESEIDIRDVEENVRRMKRATSILSAMLAAPTPAAQPVVGYVNADDLAEFRAGRSHSLTAWRKTTEGNSASVPICVAAPAAQADSGPAAAVERVVHLRSSREKRIYVAGPMTGLPEYNFPAFNAAAAALRADGWHVENPAEHGHVEGAGWDDYLRYDLSRVATCGAVYLLPGWPKSKGATLEVHVAGVLGLQLILADGAEPVQADRGVQEDAARKARLEGQHKFLEWNRGQGSARPVPGPCEYSVFNQAVDIYSAALAAKGDPV